MTSVERITACEELELEDDVTDAEDPGDEWPVKATIEFIDVSLTYETKQGELQSALKNLNLKIEHGEKVSAFHLCSSLCEVTLWTLVIFVFVEDWV